MNALYIISRIGSPVVMDDKMLDTTNKIPNKKYSTNVKMERYLLKVVCIAFLPTE